MECDEQKLDSVLKIVSLITGRRACCNPLYTSNFVVAAIYEIYHQIIHFSYRISAARRITHFVLKCELLHTAAVCIFVANSRKNSSIYARATGGGVKHSRRKILC